MAGIQYGPTGSIAAVPATHQSGVSRRSMLMGGVALGGSVLLAACGSSKSTPSAGGSSAAASAPKGGTLRMARPAVAVNESLDPASSVTSYEYLGALYNRIVKEAPDGSVGADLATHWEASADSLTWTFTFRDGVKFHNGKAFTSTDASYTIKHMFDSKAPQADILSPFMSPSGLSTPDAKTLVVKLTSPNAEFVSLLMNYNCYVIQDGSGATTGKSGIGTGPFQLVSFVPGGKGVLKANPNYFGGAPKLDGIEFTTISDTQARVNALLAGQVDLVAQTNLDYATAKTVTANPSLTTGVSKNAEWYVMPMSCVQAPFNSVAVRQAFKMAYQPTDVLDLAIHGVGTPANNNPVIPSDPNYLDYKVTPDPEKALAMLKAAGVSPSAQLYTSSYDSVLTPMSLAYQSSVKKAGINISVQTAAADSYYTNIYGKKSFFASYWYTGRPIDQLLNQIYRSTSVGNNESNWANKSFDGMLDAARKESDPAKRKVHYQDAQKLLVDESGDIVPFFSDRTIGMSKKVVNYHEYGFEFDYVNIGLKA